MGVNVVCVFTPASNSARACIKQYFPRLLGVTDAQLCVIVQTVWHSAAKYKSNLDPECQSRA